MNMIEFLFKHCSVTLFYTFSILAAVTSVAALMKFMIPSI